VNALRNAESRRLKHVVELQRVRATDDVDGPYVGLENIESWTGRLATTPDAPAPTDDDGGGGAESSVGQSQSNSFQPGDILFGKLRPYLAKAWVAAFAGRCTTEALVMRALHMKPRFLLYVLLQPSFISLVDSSTYGSKMPRAEWAFIGSVSVPCPSTVNQQVIADFLDRETARIDALVAAKQRLLDLLAEKRKAIIATAITRGLDPKVKLRDSGVPWLGEIPAHWEIVPFRWYFRIGSGDFIATDEVASEPDAARVIPVIGGNGVAGYAAVANTSDAASIVVGRVGAQCGNVHVIAGLAWVTDNALLLREIREYDVEYLAHVLRHRDLNSIANKTAQPLITGSMVTELRGPHPPLDEQRAIVDHIARETAKLDAVRAATERTIALLKERRSALIAAAVTGQLDLTTGEGAAA
jgi:type I restriction enzyme S subunit